MVDKSILPTLKPVAPGASVPEGCVSSVCKFELQVLETVLNSLDALVYVADMQTYELLFVSQYGLDVWGPMDGRKCYQYLQSGQDAPCSFCTNSKLLDANGESTGVLVWEFQNTVNRRWYQCRDQAIRWLDGRMVRLEVAVDITDRKHFEQKLELAQKQAEELARVDVLTKVHNRRAFFEYMTRQAVYLQRNPSPFSLAMLDIDYFKRVNDNYGHAVGDEALIAITRAVQDSIRESDQLFRIGGEEFVVSLVDCDEAKAFEMVERIRRNIADIEFYAEAQPIRLTCSFGITEFKPGVSIDALVAEADQALYTAKQTGRNRSCRFSKIDEAGSARA